MKILTRKSPLALMMVATITALSVLGGTVAHAASPVNVPVTASSQVAVTNVVLTTTSTSARVQFDYALVNGATTATVDAALNEQQSFGSVTVTGSGHYDVTLSGINVTSTSQFYVISSGNPDFLIPTQKNPCENDSKSDDSYWFRWRWEPIRNFVPHFGFFF